MSEVFGQKNRNRPVKITRIAISKIPDVRLPGFNTEETSFIQKQHKRLLEEAMLNNNSCEVGILLDIITWNTWVILGEGNKVEIRDDPEAYRRLKFSGKNTLMFMHNHPGTGTFSGADFKVFCQNESLYMMTVVGNDGSVRVLMKKAEFEKDSALLYYDQLAREKYKDEKYNGTLAMKELLKKCGTIGLCYINGR